MNLIATLYLSRSTNKLLEIRSQFSIASFIIDPVIVLGISYVIHNIALSLLFAYRIVYFLVNKPALYYSFVVIDMATKIYWIIISLSGILFIWSVLLFFRLTTKTNLKSRFLVLPVIFFLGGAIFVFVLSIFGLFIMVDYELGRLITGLLFVFGASALIYGINEEMEKSKSLTTRARLYIFRLIIFTLIFWILISVMGSVLRYISDFPSIGFFLPSILISFFAGFIGLITSMLMLDILNIPEWVRVKYNISQERFDRYEKLKSI